MRGFTISDVAWIANQSGSILFKYVPGVDIATLGGTFSRGSSATYLGNDGLLYTAGSDVLRDSHYIGGIRTTLLEGQRTNLLLRSEEFDDVGWNKSNNFVVTANQSLAPDGSLTADALVDNSTAGGHFIASPNISINTSTNYAISIFAKANQHTYFQLTGSNNSFSSVWANFNLSGAGVIGNKGTANAYIEKIGSWFRCAVAGMSSTFTSANVIYSLTNNTNSARLPSYTGTSGGVYGFGSQIEEGAFPSSYIKTTSATVTRAADSLSFAGRTWHSQLCTQFEEYYNTDGVLQRSVTEFTGTTPQALTLFRAYTKIIIAKGSKDINYFLAL